MIVKSKFRVVYHWRVKKSDEKKFEALWKKITLDYKKKYGAQGSCLHKLKNGDYIAYAQWPTKNHWEKMQKDTKGEIVNPFAKTVSSPVQLDVVANYLHK